MIGGQPVEEAAETRNHDQAARVEEDVDQYEELDPQATLARRLQRQTRRASVAVIGGSTVALGIVLLPLPGPGTLVILGGLTILGREFPRAARAALRARQAARQTVDRARRSTLRPR